MSKEKARELVKAFAARSGGGVFTMVDRKPLAKGLLERIENPGKINQGEASVCGPAALLYNVARDTPEKYAQFVIDLYEKGSADLGKLHIKPGSDLKAYAPPRYKVHEVDWVSLASIRDSENWFFDYQSESKQVAGITMPESLAGWFRKAGYTDVKNETNVFFTKGPASAAKASDLYKHRYKVCLFIHAGMLEADPKNRKGKTFSPNHWVVLTSNIYMSDTEVVFCIFTWGDPAMVVPTGDAPLTPKEFFNHYYGFVACKR